MYALDRWNGTSHRLEVPRLDNSQEESWIVGKRIQTQPDLPMVEFKDSFLRFCVIILKAKVC